MDQTEKNTCRCMCQVPLFVEKNLNGNVIVIVIKTNYFQRKRLI